MTLRIGLFDFELKKVTIKKLLVNTLKQWFAGKRCKVLIAKLDEYIVRAYSKSVL